MNFTIVAGALLLLLATVASAGGPRDRDIVFYTGSAATMDRDAGSTFYQGTFGQYTVRGSSCCGIGGSSDYRRYLGDPSGEIVAHWNVFFLDPAKKDRPYPERIIDRRYFYVRAPLPKDLPPRSDRHWVYEVYLSFGPRDVMASGLHPADKPHARPFRYPSGIQAYTVGDIDTVYYHIRSRPRDAKPANWLLISNAPVRFNAVKGIEITHDQYMTIACEQVGQDQCDTYLELDAPGLTPKQITYITNASESK